MMTISRFPRYVQDVFKASWKMRNCTSWKTRNCYAEGTFKTSSRHVLKPSSRRLGDQNMFAWLSLLSKILEIEPSRFNEFYTILWGIEL